MPSLTDLLDARRQRKRELLEELRPLQQDAASEEMQAAAYREGLLEERRGAEAELARLRRLRPESRQWMAWEVQVGEPPSAAERVAAAEGRLAAIDAELARVAE
jgi:hypothetical protein